MNIAAAVKSNYHFVPYTDDIFWLSSVFFNLATEYLRQILDELFRMDKISLGFVRVLPVEVFIQVFLPGKFFLETIDLLLDVQYPFDQDFSVRNL